MLACLHHYWHRNKLMTDGAGHPPLEGKLIVSRTRIIVIFITTVHPSMCTDSILRLIYFKIYWLISAVVHFTQNIQFSTHWIKHHTTKTYVGAQLQTVLILNLSTTWNWVTTLIFQLLHLQGNIPLPRTSARWSVRLLQSVWIDWWKETMLLLNFTMPRIQHLSPTLQPVTVLN